MIVRVVVSDGGDGDMMDGDGNSGYNTKIVQVNPNGSREERTLTRT